MGAATTTVERSEMQIVGSFFIDRTEFALPVDRVQEVVNVPAQITAVPLGPPFLLGVFNLRGLVIPVVDLRVLLKLEKKGTSDAQKVAIVEFEGVRVGLLFDATGEILRVPSSARSDFTSEGGGPTVISGALRLDHGNRILQVLEPQTLMKIENIPHVLEKQRKPDQALRQGGLQNKCISFSCGGLHLGIRMDGIHEILRVPEVQSSALESDLCLGMINVRGQITPLVALSKLLNRPDAKDVDPADRRVIILKIGKESFGLVVDSVDSIRSYSTNDVMPIPLLSPERAQMFVGCLEDVGAGEIVILNHEHILSNADLRSLTKGHSRIYQTDETTSAKRSSSRRVYLSFKLGQLFGVPITEVSEIVTVPQQLATAPGLPPSVKGMLNLRGQLVTVIDARSIYGLPSLESENQKILIFQSGHEKFGLVVDSVESILNVFEDQKMNVPTFLTSELSEKMGRDLDGVLEITPDGAEKFALVILNVAPLADRLRRAA